MLEVGGWDRKEQFNKTTYQNACKNGRVRHEQKTSISRLHISPCLPK